MATRTRAKRIPMVANMVSRPMIHELDTCLLGGRGAIGRSAAGVSPSFVFALLTGSIKSQILLAANADLLAARRR